MNSAKESKRAENLGKIFAHLPPDESREFRDSTVRLKVEESNLYKNNLTSKINRCVEKEKKIMEEMSIRGDVPKGMVEENILRSFMMFALLSFSVAGEFALAKWTIQPFGLGDLETNLLAVMVLIFTLEGMNYALSMLRKKFPSSQENLFLILALASILLLVLIILFGAEIRGQLFKMSTLKELAPSPGETIKGAEDFYRQTSGSFIVLMVCLSMAVMLIGGLSWHDLRNRFFPSISLWRLHRAHEKIRKEMQKLTEEIIEIEIEVQEFLAELDFSYLREKLILSERGSSSGSFLSRLQSEDSKNFWKVIGLTILLILAVIVLFFSFRGVARSETIIFLDLSQSMAAYDYSGQESEFQKNVRGVESYLTNISSGEDLKVIAVTERTFSSQYVLLEGKITNKKDAFGQGAARDRLNLLNKWRGLKLEPKASGTDLFGAMQLAEIIFGKNSGKKKLLFFSDMAQYGQGFNFEAPSVLDSHGLLKEVTQKGLVGSLDGAVVWCLGVHSTGKTPSYWKSLREFWMLYLQQARVKELKAFTPERRVNNE
jgi:hypothetical protein